MTIGCDRLYGELPKPTRAEYIFVGWFTNKTGGNETESGSMVIYTSSHTIYAHWTNMVTVKFDFRNGTVVTKIFNYNDDIVYPKGIERDKFSFIGWFTNSICTIPFDGKKATEDITLYAKYSDDKRDYSSFSFTITPIAAFVLALFMF